MIRKTEIPAANVRSAEALKPGKARFRVYIVDEVHMLTTEAFNALLKTLEEPPEHVIFILATTEVHKLPQTILSRCQRFDFHRIPPQAIADRILYVAAQEQATLEEDAAMLIAGVADGALRDALSLLDRCLAISSTIDEKVVRQAAGLADKKYLSALSACVINKNTAKALDIIDRLYSESKDMARLCDELVAHFRALMLIKAMRHPQNLLVMSADEFEQAQTQSDYLSLADIVYFMDVLSRAYQRMGRGTGDRTELEMAIVKLSSPELDATNEAIAARLTALERAVKNGVQVSPAPAFADELPEPEPVEEAKPAAAQAPVEPEPVEIAAPEEPPKADKQPEKQNEAQPPVPQAESPETPPAPISAAFVGSTAYESGSYLLIDAKNTMAFDLLKHSSQRQEVRRVIQEITGHRYNLGPYRPPEKQAEAVDPMQQFKAALQDSGITVEEA